MPKHGAVTLSDLVERGEDRLVLACERCDRRGEYGLARAIEHWGADKGLPDLKAELTADCPARQQPFAPRACAAVYVFRKGK